MKCILVVPHLLVHRGNLWLVTILKKIVNEENDKDKKTTFFF